MRPVAPRVRGRMRPLQDAAPSGPATARTELVLFGMLGAALVHLGAYHLRADSTGAFVTRTENERV